MPATKQRTVDGPEQDFLELSEVATYLRLSTSTLKRLIRDGTFPRPVEMSAGVKVWPWKDCLLWALLVEARGRMKPARTRKKPEGK